MATIASLIETAKLNNVEPIGYLGDILTKIDKLPRWAYSKDA